jgi:diguanylate cyclase (GGDEF)-like protein
MDKKSVKKNIISLKSQFAGKPRFEAIRFVAIYVLVGVIWILWSDKLLEALVDDFELYTNLQIIKGWFYVIASGGLFFFILKARLQLLHTMSKEMLYQATHDQLTGLPIKTEFARLLELKKDGLSENSRFALVRLDIDNFSNINELLDYAVGDSLLVDISVSLFDMLAHKELIGRDSGGFVFTITYHKDQFEHVTSTLDEIIQRINSEWIVEGNRLFITCSMGVALYPTNGRDFMDLYKAADLIMRHVKENVKNAYDFFEEDFISERLDKIKMMNELRKSIEEKELYLVFQPIFTMNDMNVVAFESLLRWTSPSFGQVSPAVFIQYSESIGLIEQIEEWVFEKVMELRQRWNNMGDYQTVLSVNLSSKGLTNSDFIDKIRKLYQLYNIQRNQIQIEVTETALIDNLDLAIKHLHALRAIGCKIALDDFGSGYSSLTYLQKLPIDVVKIDSLFTRRIGSSVKEDYILSSIVDLAEKLELSIVVEGIETEQQLNYIRDLHCDFGQGYYLGRPFKEDRMFEHIRNICEKANNK